RTLGRIELINGYGPTEGTTFSCCHKIESESDDRGWGIPIGRPISNTTAYVLDERQEPVAVGGVGELYIGGDGLARGYLNRPDLTAERFLPNPFSVQMGGRIYRTGDLVKYREDGRLEFIGRYDHQVKLRGFRIELGEIEAALMRSSGVEQAAVVLREDEPAKKRLTAYIVPKAGSSIDTQDLRRQLGGRLPDYMIPAAIMALEGLPLTSSGKVDRQALVSMEPAMIGGGAEYLAP